MHFFRLKVGFNIFVIFILGCIIGGSLCEYFYFSHNVLRIGKIFSLLALVLCLWNILACLTKKTYISNFKYGMLYFWVFLFAFFNTMLWNSNVISGAECIDKCSRFVGVVDDAPSVNESRVCATLKVIKLDNIKVNNNLRVLVYIDDEDKSLQLNYGDVLLVKGGKIAGDNTHNPGGFNYLKYNRIKGFVGSVFIKRTQVQVIDQEKGNVFKNIGINLRNNIVDIFNKNLGEDYGGLASVMFMSYKNDIDEDVKEGFRLAGLSHLMAVSGLNVSVISSIIFAFLAMFRLKRRGCIIGAEIGLVLYLLVTGFSPSIVRAFIMYSTVFVAEVVERSHDKATTLAFSAFLLLLIRPMMYLEVGFQLSFVAVGTIFFVGGFIRICSKKLTGKNKFFQSIFETFLMGIAVNIAITPIIVFHYNSINLMGIFSNLLIPSPIVYMLNLSLIVALILHRIGLLGSMVFAISKFILNYIVKVVAWAAGMDFSSLGVNQPTIKGILIIVVIIGICVLIRIVRKPGMKTVGLCTCVLLFLVVGYPNNNYDYRLIFFDVGQGDSSLYKLKSGKNIVIDTGDGDEDISSLLFANGVGVVDYLVLTHSHIDHIGGAEKIMKEHTVNLLILPHEMKKYEAIYKKYKGVKRIVYVKGGEFIKISDKEMLKVLVADNKSDDINDLSIVTELDIDGYKVLSCGDITSNIENRYIEKFDDVDLLKVAHHGSKYSTCDEFLDRVKAEKMVVSVGVKNNFGHPSRDTIERIYDSGGELFRTDKDGAVIVDVDLDNNRKYEKVTVMN